MIKETNRGKDTLQGLNLHPHGIETQYAMITDSFKRLASEVFLLIPGTPLHKRHGQKKSPHTYCVV